jgi:hypothetical protein
MPISMLMQGNAYEPLESATEIDPCLPLANQVGFVSERSVRKLQLPLNRLKARLLAYGVQERVGP